MGVFIQFVIVRDYTHSSVVMVCVGGWVGIVGGGGHKEAKLVIAKAAQQPTQSAGVVCETLQCGGVLPPPRQYSTQCVVAAIFLTTRHKVSLAVGLGLLGGCGAPYCCSPPLSQVPPPLGLPPLLQLGQPF